MKLAIALLIGAASAQDFGAKLDLSLSANDTLQNDLNGRSALVTTKVNDANCGGFTQFNNFIWAREKVVDGVTTYEAYTLTTCPTLQSDKIKAWIASNAAITAGTSTDCSEGKDPTSWGARVTLTKAADGTWAVVSAEGFDETDMTWDWTKLDGADDSTTKADYDEVLA